MCDRALLTAIVHIMTNVVADGKSNWLEGAILICLLFGFRLGFSTAADIISMLQVFTLI